MKVLQLSPAGVGGEITKDQRVIARGPTHLYPLSSFLEPLFFTLLPLKRFSLSSLPLRTHSKIPSGSSDFGKEEPGKEDVEGAYSLS